MKSMSKGHIMVPHGSRILNFQQPPFRGFYTNVTGAIGNKGLKVPSSPETALFVDRVSNGWRYGSEITDIIEKDLMWEPTGNLFTGEGVRVQTNPQVNGVLPEDRSLSGIFVPFGFKTGRQTPDELANNPYMIARYGKGVEEVAEFSTKFRKGPVLCIFDSVSKTDFRMSALGGSKEGLKGSLFVHCGLFPDSISCYSFGFLEEKD